MKGTHSDHNEMPEPVGDAKAGNKKNRPLDKEQGDKEPDTSAAGKVEVLPFGKVAEEIAESIGFILEASDDELLESFRELSEEELTVLDEGALAKIGAGIKKGAQTGNRVGGKVGKVAGTAAGAAAGGVAGHGAGQHFGSPTAGAVVGGAYGALVGNVVGNLAGRAAGAATGAAAGGAKAIGQMAAARIRGARSRADGKRKVAKEDLDLLFANSGLTLTEEFSSKALTLFEGAVSHKVSEIRSELTEQFQASLQEAIAEHEGLIESTLDTYLDLFVEEYMKKNELAIVSGIKQEFAESIAESVTSVIDAFGIDLPEEKIDIAESLTAELLEREAALNEQVDANASLKASLRQYEIKEAFAAATSDLTDVDREKLSKLVENISFDDVADYTVKVNTLKESISSAPDTAPDNASDVNRSVDLQESAAEPVLEDWKLRILKAARGEI